MNLLTLIDESAARFDEKFVTDIPKAGGKIVQVQFPEELKSFLRAEQMRVVEAVREWAESKKMTMEAALKSGSDAGAGYTIGQNSILSDLLLALPDKPKEV